MSGDGTCEAPYDTPYFGKVSWCWASWCVNLLIFLKKKGQKLSFVHNINVFLRGILFIIYTKMSILQITTIKAVYTALTVVTIPTVFTLTTAIAFV